MVKVTIGSLENRELSGFVTTVSGFLLFGGGFLASTN
jgi:hypothetical protein